jgi:hypothetical protein
MINAHAQILYGRSKKQFDQLVSAFKRDSNNESIKKAVPSSPPPPNLDVERFRNDVERQKKAS